MANELTGDVPRATTKDLEECEMMLRVHSGPDADICAMLDAVLFELRAIRGLLEEWERERAHEGQDARERQ